MTIPVLSVRDLAYAYPDGTQALAGVSFDLQPGERLSLLGANGAGKSTLLLHLNGLLMGRGNIAVSGLAVTRSNLAEVRRRVGFVFQDPDDQLFCPSLAEDVAFAPRHQRLPREEIARRVAAALAAVGLAGLEHRPPQHLSLGEKKRAALATVLASEPDLLVLDEPTANLDPRGRRELVELLNNLGKPMVVATHDFSLARELCPRALVLTRGRVVADGVTDMVLADIALLDAAGLS